MDIRFTHVCLLVRDFKACFRFYRDILGFKATEGDENGGYASFETGNAAIALFGRTAMADAIGKGDLPLDAECQDTASLIFEVPDVDGATRELKSKGCRFDTELTDQPGWGIRAAHFRDPYGKLIEINQPLNRTE